MNRTAAFILFLIGSTILVGQTEGQDAQLWGYLKVEKKLSKRSGIYLKLKGRAINNMMVPGRGAADLGFSYMFTKNIRTKISYQHVQKLKNSGRYATQHQFRASLMLKAEVDHWSFIYRNMLQVRSNGLIDDRDNHMLYYYDRNKFTLRYELNKRVALYAAEEVYIPLNNPQVKGLSKSRSFGGTLINITKRQQLDLFFMYQLQLQKGDWYNQDISYPNETLAQKFVYGIGYTIEF